MDKNTTIMVTQSEQVLENGLIKTLKEMNYEYISIKEDRKSTRLNSSHNREYRMPSSA